ncbi:hypothetical protein KBB89_02145 [Candidatus Gracilibacteria bacterium]|nr:hypothetical protein [Candidatus Gracilibacteria bacterium]
MALYGETPSNIIIKDLPKREAPETAYRPREVEADATPEEKIDSTQKTIERSAEKFHDGVTMEHIYSALGVNETDTAAEKTKAIETFQTQNGLRGTGAIDPSTLEALDKATGDDRSFSGRVESPANTVEAGHGTAQQESDGGIKVSVSAPSIAEGAPQKQEGDRPAVPEASGKASSTTEAPTVADTGTQAENSSWNNGIYTPAGTFPYDRSEVDNKGGTEEKDEIKSDTTIPTVADTPPTGEQSGETVPTTRSISTPTIGSGAQSGIPPETPAEGIKPTTDNTTPTESSQQENNQYPGESGFDAAAKESLAGFVRGALQNDPNSATTMESFIAGTKGLSYGEALKIAENIEGVNPENLGLAAIGGVEGYDQEKEILNNLYSPEDLAGASLDESAIRFNQKPVDPKYDDLYNVDEAERNIAPYQPSEYIDVEGKTLDERMKLQKLPEATQQRIRDSLELQNNNAPASFQGSPIPYLQRNFYGMNMRDLGDSAYSNMDGNLSAINGVNPGARVENKISSMAAGKAFNAQIDGKTGQTFIPGIGKIVYAGGKHNGPRMDLDEDKGILITEEGNSFGAPVGSIISERDTSYPVFKAGSDGQLKQIGYINSPDIYGGNGRFVGKDPFENPPPKPEQLSDTIKL